MLNPFIVERMCSSMSDLLSYKKTPESQHEANGMFESNHQLSFNNRGAISVRNINSKWQGNCL